MNKNFDSLVRTVIRTKKLSMVAEFYSALGVVVYSDRHGCGMPYAVGNKASIEIVPETEKNQNTAQDEAFSVYVSSIESVITALRKAKFEDAILRISRDRDNPRPTHAELVDPDGRSVTLYLKK